MPVHHGLTQNDPTLNTARPDAVPGTASSPHATTDAEANDRGTALWVSVQPALIGKDRSRPAAFDQFRAQRFNSMGDLIRTAAAGVAVAGALFRSGKAQSSDFVSTCVLLLDVDGQRLTEVQQQSWYRTFAAGGHDTAGGCHVFFELDSMLTTVQQVRRARAALHALTDGIGDDDYSGWLLFGYPTDALDITGNVLSWSDLQPPVSAARFAHSAPSTTGRASTAYAAAALRAEAQQVASTLEGARNTTLFNATLKMWGFTLTDAIDPMQVQQALADAGRLAGLAERETQRTIQQGKKYAEPRYAPASKPSASSYGQLSNAARTIMHTHNLKRGSKLFHGLHFAGVQPGERLTVGQARGRLDSVGMNMGANTIRRALTDYDGLLWDADADRFTMPDAAHIDDVLDVKASERGKGDPLRAEDFADSATWGQARLYALLQRRNRAGKRRHTYVWLAGVLGKSRLTVIRYANALKDAGKIQIRHNYTTVAAPAEADQLAEILPRGDERRNDFLVDDDGDMYPATVDALSFAQQRSGQVQHRRQLANTWIVIQKLRQPPPAEAGKGASPRTPDVHRDTPYSYSTGGGESKHSKRTSKTRDRSLIRQTGHIRSYIPPIDAEKYGPYVYGPWGKALLDYHGDDEQHEMYLHRMAVEEFRAVVSGFRMPRPPSWTEETFTPVSCLENAVSTLSPDPQLPPHRCGRPAFNGHDLIDLRTEEKST